MKKFFLLLSIIILGYIPKATAHTLYLATSANRLASFDSSDPQTLLTDIAITGILADEDIEGIDFRPSTGELYALGLRTEGLSQEARLYTLDINSGVATLVGAGPFKSDFSDTADNFGFTFDPVSDLIRITDTIEDNLSLDPDTAVPTTDTDLAYATGDTHEGDSPTVSSVAFTNSFPGATETTAYAIDGALDILARLGGMDGTLPLPSSGQLFTVGDLIKNAAGTCSMDIASDGTAYAFFSESGTPGLFLINLSTGEATPQPPPPNSNQIGDGMTGLEGIAVFEEFPPTPTPTATPLVTPSPSPAPGPAPIVSGGGCQLGESFSPGMWSQLFFGAWLSLVYFRIRRR
ncbi:MAG: DUF4394 domain-containing protein [Deltaproteobacteria bacterium]|nr:DUF4394 domain-containing protein [Deltaproteobacteria bacterium]